MKKIQNLIAFISAVLAFLNITAIFIFRTFAFWIFFIINPEALLRLDLGLMVADDEGTENLLYLRVFDMMK